VGEVARDDAGAQAFALKARGECATHEACPAQQGNSAQRRGFFQHVAGVLVPKRVMSAMRLSKVLTFKPSRNSYTAA
jgi:hypothetical protein